LLQSNEDSFIHALKNKPNSKLNIELPSKTEEHRIKKSYESLIKEALHMLQKGSINEVEVSSLFNIYREIYSAHKALLSALESMNKIQNN
jgi:hypothetical protein